MYLNIRKISNFTNFKLVNRIPAKTETAFLLKKEFSFLLRTKSEWSFQEIHQEVMNSRSVSHFSNFVSLMSYLFKIDIDGDLFLDKNKYGNLFIYFFFLLKLIKKYKTLNTAFVEKVSTIKSKNVGSNEEFLKKVETWNCIKTVKKKQIFSLSILFTVKIGGKTSSGNLLENSQTK